jgi:(p)ppGpp synthase/HD superfamily hydrolase
MIIEAAQFAKICHEGQKRKFTGTPYIFHPARVAARTMLLNDVTESMVCAAWSHDLNEDCGISLDEIGRRFGEETRQYVWELTNPSKGKSLPRSERKEMDRRHLRLVSHQAKCIKLIDRIDNIGESINGPKDWCALYLRESKLLLEVLQGVCPELEDELKQAIYKLGTSVGIEA